MKAAKVEFFFTFLFSISIVNEEIWSIVIRPFLNPFWLPDKFITCFKQLANIYLHIVGIYLYLFMHAVDYAIMQYNYSPILTSKGSKVRRLYGEEREMAIRLKTASILHIELR